MMLTYHGKNLGDNIPHVIDGEVALKTRRSG